VTWNVTVWDECQPGLQEHYPSGVHAVIAEGLRSVGAGRIFYFSPAHEEQPVYHQPKIQLIIASAVEWACPCSS
jgi:trehalose utilization protein